MPGGRSVRVHARVRGRVWSVVSGLRGVLIGPLIVWNRTNKCVRVSFCADVVVKVWVSSVFFLGGFMHDLGVEMS